MLYFLICFIALAGQISASESFLSSNTSLAPSLDRWPGGLHLAVDYYPSQWPEYMWEPDFARMQSANISYVRISEFDWAVLEPREGHFNFTLLDKTIELMAKYNLRAIIGTPTAGPPDWAIENYDIGYVDRTNTTLLFGSRRSYSFSSFDYRILSQKITLKLAQRYGSNPAVVGWQLDNEFGCHDTIRSYDHNAMARFRSWLAAKYDTIQALNDAQGRVFWSQAYASFDAVQPPFLEIYTLNYAHTLDWYRFSSDMVIEFAKEQATILRQYAPSQAITTNMMMGFLDFDHQKFASEVGLDFVTFDEYPLAVASQFSWLTTDEVTDALRTGLPDYQAFQHAVYRGIAGAAYGNTTGPFGVMEMEPGMLNWGQYRVSPAEGMVRLWTHETFAASGDLVSYFRWRQVPYAQEQTLSGLFVSDNTEDTGFVEQQIVANEDLPKLIAAGASEPGTRGDTVALVFDYTSQWVWQIEPYSGIWDVKSAGYTDPAVVYFDMVYVFYTALRRLGLSIEIIGPDQALSSYKMVVVPSLPIIPDNFDTALAAYPGPVVFGPHTGSKTPQFTYAPGLNPSAGVLRDRLPMRVSRVETPPVSAGSSISYAGTSYNISGWEEWITCARGNATSSSTILSTSPHRLGKAAACTNDGLHYLGFHPPADLLVAYLGDVAQTAGIAALTGKTASKEEDLGASIRLLKRGDLIWVFNYGLKNASVPEIDGNLVVGSEGDLEGPGLAVWKMN